MFSCTTLEPHPEIIRVTTFSLHSEPVLDLTPIRKVNGISTLRCATTSTKELVSVGVKVSDIDDNNNGSDETCLYTISDESATDIFMNIFLEIEISHANWKMTVIFIPSPRKALVRIY